MLGSQEKLTGKGVGTMNLLRTILIVVFLAAGMQACTYAKSGMPTATNVNGDAWYVETVGMPGINFVTRVMYCPNPPGRGSATCTQAKMNKEVTESESGYGSLSSTSTSAADSEDDSEESGEGEADMDL